MGRRGGGRSPRRRRVRQARPEGGPQAFVALVTDCGGPLATLIGGRGDYLEHVYLCREPNCPIHPFNDPAILEALQGFPVGFYAWEGLARLGWGGKARWDGAFRPADAADLEGVGLAWPPPRPDGSPAPAPAAPDPEPWTGPRRLPYRAALADAAAVVAGEGFAGTTAEALARIFRLANEKARGGRGGGR
jgi:hypothetical protein